MNRIAQLRKDAKLSQRELADVLKVHQTSISQWETGRTGPDFANLMSLCEVFNVRPEYLLGRSEERGHWGLTDEEADALAADEVRDTISDPPDKNDFDLQLFAEDENKRRIDAAYSQLNDEGQRTAADRVEELAELPRYQRKDELESPD